MKLCFIYVTCSTNGLEAVCHKYKNIYPYFTPYITLQLYRAKGTVICQNLKQH